MDGKWKLGSSCDDSGAMLLKRLDDPTFVRVISSHATEPEAEDAKREWMDWYRSRNVPIGEGCLAVWAD